MSKTIDSKVQSNGRKVNIINHTTQDEYCVPNKYSTSQAIDREKITSSHWKN